MKQGDVQTSIVFPPLLCTNRFAIILGQETIRNEIKLIQCRAILALRKVTKLSGSHEKCCLLACAFVQDRVCLCMHVWVRVFVWARVFVFTFVCARIRSHYETRRK